MRSSSEGPTFMTSESESKKASSLESRPNTFASTLASIPATEVAIDSTFLIVADTLSRSSNKAKGSTLFPADYPMSEVEFRDLA